MRTLVLLLAVGAVLVSWPTGSAYLAGGPYHWDRSSLLTGYLTWSGSPGISWTENPSTPDPGGPTPDSTNNPKYTAAGNLQSLAGSDQGLYRVDSFVSQPLPDLYYLNASRSIELTIYVKSQECSDSTRMPALDTFDVELWAGSTFVAGSLHDPYISTYQFGGTWVAGGYCNKYFFMHPEVDRLEAGATLTLKILHRGQGLGWQYGMGGTHASRIQFHFFPPDEVQQRIPEVVAARIIEDEPVDDSSPTTGPGLVGLAVPVAGLALVARRPRRALLAAALVAAAMAGCLGGGGGPVSTGSAAPSGDVEYHFEKVGNDSNLLSGFGSILGVVQDPYNFAVSGAHVSLLGTSNFTTTNSKGQFEFSNIPANTYAIRVDRKGYASIDKPLVVRENAITRVTITMVPLVDKGAGFRPHDHNDWGDRTEMPIFDGDVRFRTYSYDTGQTTDDLACSNVDPYRAEYAAVYAAESVAFATNYNMYARTDCIEPFALKDSNLVLPGTYEIEAKVLWDTSVNKVEKVGLGFSDNRPWNSNDTALYPRGPGEPFHIRTAWDMTDVGHQRFSTWSFYLYVTANDGSPANPMVSHQTLGGPFHVQMTIKKGIVNLEPAHPDWFGDNVTYATFSNYNAYAYCPSSYFYANGYTSPCQDYEAYWYQGYPRQPNMAIVPQGTKWLDVWLNETSAAPLGPPGWDLKYIPANVPPSQRLDPGYQPKEAKYVGTDTKRLHYVIPVTDDEADPFYARGTGWDFRIEERHGSPQVYSGQVNWKFQVISHKNAMPV